VLLDYSWIHGLAILCGAAIMLSSVTNTAREYRVHAANGHALATTAANASERKLYLDFERYWLDRALDYEWADGSAGSRKLPPLGQGRAG
jgi:hypothetical protein